MNKLYILGALALAAVKAEISSYTAPGLVTGSSIPNTGTITYTVSTDCFSTATASSLGMNNIYHQYYSFKLSKGSVSITTTATTLSTPGITPAPAAITVILTYYANTYTYSGCYHQHLYNWMAQPQVGATTAVGGFGNAATAYGYAMTGTAITSCTAITAVSTTILTGSKFYGAKYQHVAAIISGTGVTPNIYTAITTSVNVVGQVGPGYYYYTKAATLLTFAGGPASYSAGFVTTSAQNAYWDFMQTNVIQGMTQFGRGGGATTTPCGWYVIYAYEAPQFVRSDDVTAVNVNPDNSDITMHMWTDNSVIKAASAFVFTALAGLLF